jgi:hypothetical protein
MNKIIHHLGLDVHKESIAVAFDHGAGKPPTVKESRNSERFDRVPIGV